MQVSEMEWCIRSPSLYESLYLCTWWCWRPALFRTLLMLTLLPETLGVWILSGPVRVDYQMSSSFAPVLSCAINKPHVYFLMLLKWAFGIWASWRVQRASIRCLVRALPAWLLSEAIWNSPRVFRMWLNFNSKGRMQPCICWFSGFSFLPASLPTSKWSCVSH